MNKAFVINLNTQLEIFLEVERAFAAYGIQCERYVVKREEHKQLSCTKTHLEIIAHAKKEGRPYVFVVEDDCCLQETMREWPAIARFLVEEQKEWDVFLGGVLFPWPKKLVSNFCVQGTQEIEMIECSHGVTAHFVIYNKSCYDRMLKWYDLPGPLAERPNIDNLFEQCKLRIWVPSPFLAVQKSHSNCDWTREFQHAENKFRYFSKEMKKSLKYRLLNRWMKIIS